MTVQDWLGKDNELGIDIWCKKYQRGTETFDEWLERVSGGDEEVANLIREKKFLFGGRILSNRNVDDSKEKTTYSNCYVISPPEDNLESIYDTCKKLARTYSYGGGCGIDISKLAPEGAEIHNQAKSTSGAVSFMDTFSQVTEQIGQNGRRGALMISIDCTHPDLEKFITVKSDLNKVTAANISVRISDKFMVAVQNDADWELSFTRPETGETISKTVKAKDIFELLCKNNWNYAEPGMLFWDRINHWNMLSTNPDFEYAGVNPCAEETLPAGGSCLLGALNLAAFVDDEGRFDYSAFAIAVRIAVRALNKVLDEGISKHPLLEQRNSVTKWRQIGLGIMGLADMLIKMKIRYGSQEAVSLCNQIAYLYAYTAISESSKLAKEEGAYDGYDYRVTESPFFNAHKSDELLAHVETYGLRNSQLLTIAPTGSISTMLGVSGGIEPIFANSYTRMTKSLHGGDVAYKVYTPIVKAYMDANNLNDDSSLPDYFVTSADIPVNERINMQGIWQDHIDASISSTVNLPHEATVEDVEQLYMQAWERGLKGITVYRAGCAREGILTTSEGKDKGKDEKPVKTAPTSSESHSKMSSVKGKIGLERHLTTGCGSLHVCAFFDEEGNLKNTYLSKGSTGGCNNFMIGLSRMISLAARSGVAVQDIVDQLKSSGTCPSYAVRRATKNDTSVGSSCPVAVGNALLEMWKEVNPEKCDNSHEKPMEKCDIPRCPECGTELVFRNGCNDCPSCGWSKCSG